jgi:alkylation response protein AidB-like acyl-CoA dehydrogenase
MYAMKRKTFGKALISHQIIRYKLAEMVRQVESLQDNIERIVYQFACGMADHKMGSQCALLKVQASKTFEYCAREASQIFGGAAVVKEGQGAVCYFISLPCMLCVFDLLSQLFCEI